MLTDNDLLKNKYTIAELEASIDNLSVKYLLNYQKLNAEFCAKYILSDYCATCQEDTYICTGDVLNKQPHLTRSELNAACLKFNTFGLTPFPNLHIFRL
jgi:hypothetical protein